MTRANRAGSTPPGPRVVIRRSGFLTAVLLVLCATQALLAPAVSAHNVLISSTPAADSVLSAAPASIVLVFDQNVEPTYAKVAVTVAGHDPVEITPTVNGPTVTADLGTAGLPDDPPTGAAVAWRVGYRVVSADGHPVSGIVDFSVGAATTPTDTAPTDAAAAGQQRSLQAGDTAAAAAPAAGTPWRWIGGGLLAVLAVAAGAVALRGYRRGSRADR